MQLVAAVHCEGDLILCKRYMVIATLILVVFVLVWTKPNIAATFEVLLSGFLSNLVVWHFSFI